MKDYLNSQEKDELVTFIKSIDHASIIETKWLERGNLAKEEVTALRHVITWSKKFINSMLQRQNGAAQKAIGKTMRNGHLILDYKDSLTELLRKRSSEITDGYEENKDYFALIELLMHYNCKDCCNKCSTCAIYNEFEAQNIPELNEGHDNGLCKFSYKRLGGQESE